MSTVEHIVEELSNLNIELKRVTNRLESNDPALSDENKKQVEEQKSNLEKHKLVLTGTLTKLLLPTPPSPTITKSEELSDTGSEPLQSTSTPVSVSSLKKEPMGSTSCELQQGTVPKQCAEDQGTPDTIPTQRLLSSLEAGISPLQQYKTGGNFSTFCRRFLHYVTLGQIVD